MVKLTLKGPRRPSSDQNNKMSEWTPPTESGKPPEDTSTKADTSIARRSSVRTKSTSESTSKSTSPLAKTNVTVPLPTSKNSGTQSSSSPDGTIQVHQKSIRVEDDGDSDSSLSDLDDFEQQAPLLDTAANVTNMPQRSMSAPISNRPWGRKGKAPTRGGVAGEQDLDMVDADETVSEFSFRDESDVEKDGDDGNGLYSDPDATFHQGTDKDPLVIASDDEEQEEKWDLSHRPWLQFDRNMRQQWEIMYCNVTMHAIGGDWDVTEQYQNQKDKEMLRYIEDFPLAKWVISHEHAEAAYDRMLFRERWRQLGTRIYDDQRGPGMNIPMNLQRPLQATRDRFPHEPMPAIHPSQQMPPMQQQVPNRAMPHVLPQQMLPSQPMTQPMPMLPNGMPMYPSHPIAMSGTAPGMPPHMANMPMHAGRPMYGPPVHQMMPPTFQARRGREKKIETPPLEPPLPPPPTPPYPKREKPTEHKAVNKTGRRSMRRAAEANVFPWHRDIDFKAARANATWDDSIYDQQTMNAMAATRAKNEPIIEKIDTDESEKQRQSRISRKQTAQNADGSDADAEKLKRERKKPEGRGKGGNQNSGDPYHSGDFCFATQEDQQRAMVLSKKTVEDIMNAANAGNVSLDVCGEIKICWNPGKKGITQDLVQAHFSIKDTLLTRKQLTKTLVLTHRAAECIVDFCPDMLWRDMLLRITSEAGYGNKDVRDRMCHNGNYADKATITKRIGAALGKKQEQSSAAKKRKQERKELEALNPELAKNKGYLPGEDEWYNMNVQDFSNYVEYFGKRTSHRNALKFQPVGSKRKAEGEVEMVNAGNTSGYGKVGSPSKHDGVEDTQSPEDQVETPSGPSGDDAAETTGPETGTDGEGEEDGEEPSGGDTDAVSVQSDGELDRMVED